MGFYSRDISYFFIKKMLLVMKETREQMIARREKSKAIQERRKERMKKQVKIVTPDIDGNLSKHAKTWDGHPMSVRDIAKVCNCTVKSIWVIEQRALSKLRINAYLEEYLE